ncbi:MAG: LPS export ABC transporter periplasmic protein LptC [Burkholderiaceae bacterium]|nr:LPS export ABC transporter periplasmic protein LptC [Burkholderiaceae bacterium]
MRGLLHRGWDGVAIYIPVLLMALLALGTWWLVRNAPGSQTAPVADLVREGPDYLMTKFSIQNFDLSGQLHSETQGEVARHYPQTDTLEIDQMQMRSLTNKGLLTRATAERALSNADGSEIQLFGNAIVTREAAQPSAGTGLPRLEFRGEFLHIWPHTERVYSHQPVSLVRGKDRFTADSLEYDNLDQVLQLRGRVRGVLVPGRSN